ARAKKESPAPPEKAIVAEPQSKPQAKPAKAAKPVSGTGPLPQTQRGEEGLSKVPSVVSSAKTAPEPSRLADATHAVSQVAALLADERAAQFRPRLIRALNRFAPLAQVIAGRSDLLSAKDRERVEKRLRRLLGELADAATHLDFDRKAQARLA